MHMELINKIPMKKIVISITTLLLFIFQCGGQEQAQAGKTTEAKPEEAKEVAGMNISKVFADHEVTNKMEMKGMKVYTYMLNHKFADLQATLTRFLGVGWILEDADVQAQAMAAAQKQVEAQGMKVLGMVSFKNKKKPGSMVMLMQMALPGGAEGDDEQAMVTLTHIDM